MNRINLKLFADVVHSLAAWRTVQRAAVFSALLAPPGCLAAPGDSTTDAEPPVPESQICIVQEAPTPLLGRLLGSSECAPLTCGTVDAIRLCESVDGACVLGSCVSIACSGNGCAP